MTQQGARQAAWRKQSGTTGTYNGDMMAASAAVTGISTGTANEHLFRWCKAITGSTNTDLQGQANAFAAMMGCNNIGAVGENETPTLVYDFTQGLTAPSALTYTRASTATYVDDDGVLQTAAINTPRITSAGLLREGASTNLVADSEDLSAASYSTTSMTVATNQTAAPDGATTADKLTYGATGTSFIRTAGITVSASTSYTFSFWVKNIDAAALSLRIYDVTNAAAIVAEESYVSQVSTTGWTRITKTFTTPVGCVSVYVYPAFETGATSGQSFYVWGLQVEALSFATSYIPTSGGSAARSADYVTIDTGAWGASGKGALVCEYSLLGDAGAFDTIFAYGNNTTSVGVFHRINAGVQQTVVIDTSTQASVNNGAPAAGATYKLGVSYETNNVKVCLDGGSVTTDTSATIPTTSKLLLGSATTSSRPTYGYIKRFIHFDRALTSTQLQNLTT